MTLREGQLAQVTWMAHVIWPLGVTFSAAALWRRGHP
jgi:hypothetical protein